MTVNEFHVLLIDDDEDDFVHLRDLFDEIPRSKYKMTWKSNYREGLEALHSQPFDVCLLDYRLGEHTGMDLLQEVQKLNSVCPIIVLTGHGDFDLDLQAMQMGASEYLVKSQLNAHLLERTVRYAIKHAHDMQELKESKAQILQQDRLASLGLLASSLAHEIGTPLGIIRSRAEIMQKKAATDVIKQDMDAVIAQIDKITKLVYSLLNLARDKQAEFTGDVQVNQVIQDVLNLTQHEFQRNDIELKLDVAEHLNVKAESGPLGQVLLNLLVNALHAIEEAKRSGRTTNHLIILSAMQNKDFVEISIQDSGCGIPEKNKRQLFKPFFTTKDVGLGSGLGLAISYKLVQSWGGSISVDSQENRGSIFKIKLQKGAKA